MFVSVLGDKHNRDVPKHTTECVSSRLPRPPYSTVVSSARVLQPHPQQRRGLANTPANASICSLCFAQSTAQKHCDENLSGKFHACRPRCVHNPREPSWQPGRTHTQAACPHGAPLTAASPRRSVALALLLLLLPRGTGTLPQHPSRSRHRRRGRATSPTPTGGRRQPMAGQGEGAVANQRRGAGPRSGYVGRGGVSPAGRGAGGGAGRGGAGLGTPVHFSSL